MEVPGDETAAWIAGRGQFRASQADREQAIEIIKTAFAEDRLTKDELDLRVGQAITSRIYAELAALTGDLHAWPAADRPAAAGPPSSPARTLAKAVRRAGICMLVAFALAMVVVLANSESLVPLAFFPGVAAVIAASGFLGYGVVDAWQEHRSRGQLPPQPGRDGRGLEGGRPGHDPAPPGARGARRSDPCRPANPSAGAAPSLPVRMGFAGTTRYTAHTGRRITKPAGSPRPLPRPEPGRAA